MTRLLSLYAGTFPDSAAISVQIVYLARATLFHVQIPRKAEECLILMTRGKRQCDCPASQRKEAKSEEGIYSVS